MTDWRHHAACRSACNPDLFFTTGYTDPALRQIAEAKAVCRRCPVTEDCLAWAIATGQDAGVWGGLGEDERRDLNRLLARTGPTIRPRNAMKESTGTDPTAGITNSHADDRRTGTQGPRP